MISSIAEYLPRRRSLLVGADDPVILRALADRFTSSGNVVRTTDCGAGVLRSMHVELPDLVILNPGPEFFDGLLDRQLRADSLTKNVPVLIVASPVALENLETKPDPDLILAKPVMLDVLEARVDRLLRNVPAPHADLLALGAA